MSSIDFTEPFADRKVGIIYGEFTTQGGAEILNAQMARQLDAPIYTREYKPEHFGARMNDILSERVVALGNIEQDSLDGVEVRFPGPGPSEPPDSGGGGSDPPPTTDPPTDDGGGTPPGYRAAGFLSQDDSLVNDIDTSRIQTDVLIAGDADGAEMAYQSDIPYIMYVHHSGKPLVDFFWDHFDAKTSILGKLKFLRERRRVKKELNNVATRSDMVLYNSAGTAKICNDQWNAADEKQAVCYPAYQDDIYNESVEPWKYIEGKRFFVAAQRLDPYKNVHLIVNAAKLAKEHVVIVGSGTLDDFVRREEQQSKYIHSLGYMKADRLAQLYAGATATIQATLHEDFGIVPLESMAVGTPCITPASGGFLETVGRGHEENPGTYQTDRGMLVGTREYDARSLAGAMQNHDGSDYDSEDIMSYARKFDEARLGRELNMHLDDVYGITQNE
jgi:glycosyltransferase involved in cell wall biosynthesis